MVIQRVPDRVALPACLLAVLCGCGLRGEQALQAVAARGLVQGSSSTWLYIAEWPGHAGPGQVAHEELWVGSTGPAKWRSLAERNVLALDDAVHPSLERVAELRSIALSRPSVVRPMGDRQSAIDGRIGPYLTVAVGTGEGVSEIGDEAAFLEQSLVSAARELLRSVRPRTPILPPTPHCWVQTVPLRGSLIALLDRDRQIRTLSSDAVAARAAVAQTIAFPYLWVAVDGDALEIDRSIVLTRVNPAAAVRLGDRVFQMNLQTSR